MSNNKNNFKSWFADVLDSLYSNGNAGFVILMVAFPLIERYLRGKSGIHEADLNLNNGRFYNELVTVFPELTSRNNARNFWQVYRNGLLHQVTLPPKNKKGIRMPDGWVSNKGTAVSIDSNGVFWVHPSELAKRVIDTVEKDFSTFEGGRPLPSVHQLPTVLGTGVPYTK